MRFSHSAKSNSFLGIGQQPHTCRDVWREFWGVCVDLSVTAGFRCPSEQWWSTRRSVFNVAFKSRQYQCQGTVRWKCSQRASKDSIQAKASGIHHCRVIVKDHQILFFRGWHVYKLFKLLSFAGCSPNQAFCLIHNIWFITVFFRWICQLPFLFFLFWTGCAGVWYGSKLKTDFFLFCFLNSSWEVMTDLTSNEKNKLHPHRIKHAAWPTHSSSDLRQKLIIIKTFQCFIRTTT